MKLGPDTADDQVLHSMLVKALDDASSIEWWPARHWNSLRALRAQLGIELSEERDHGFLRVESTSIARDRYIV